MLDEDNKPIREPKKVGRLCIKLPMLPSFMSTLYNNDEAFLKKDMSEAPGIIQLEMLVIDEDGYVNVVTRVDDMINTAGHR